MSSEECQILTIKEVAKLIRVPIGSVYNMVHKNKIPYFKVNRLVRFDREKVLQHFMKVSSDIK